MGNVNNVKQVYTSNEWAAREQYYIQEVGQIVLPSNPSSKDVMRIVAEIDSLLSESMMDCAFIKRKYQDLDTKMKLAEKETFVIIKQNNANPPQGGTAVPQKLTESDVKGMVVKYLRSHPLSGMNYDIYTVIQSVEYRLVFIESVVKMLSEKKMSIFADKAMLSIEAGMTNN